MSIEEIKSFVKEHVSEDPVKLRLKFHGDSREWVDRAITHIQCMQKAGNKFIISSTGQQFAPILMQSPLSVEQATSGDIAMFHSSLIAPGSRVLDMTMGMGIDTMAMAMVENAVVTSCELSPLLAETGRLNFADYGNVTVVEGDSVEFVKSCDKSFDVIFIDPARRGDNGQRVYNLHDCQPDLIEILPLLLNKSPRVIAKLSPMLDVSQTINDLEHVSSLYCVDNGSECKEILAVIDRDFEGETEVVVVNGDKHFSFTLSEERMSAVSFGVPSFGDYLLEPSPSMMKAGPFRLITTRWSGVLKLGGNTQLYVSSTDIHDFPGRCLPIIDVFEFSSGNIKRFKAKYPEINITVRNFPMTVDKLYSKLKVKQGGNLRLFATTVADCRKLLIVTGS